MFIYLTEEMLDAVAGLCQPESYPAGSTIVERNTPSDSFYLIQAGAVKIIPTPESETGSPAEAFTVTLGKGQSFGEMGLVDSGTRSATVKAMTDTQLLAIDCQLFRELCEKDTNLGYQVMRNIAADLSFRLRHRNLI
jgi:CRP/FNR family cyclic AMP-dependent transcriptional regulator